MFRFLPAALALAGLFLASGCLTESAEFRNLAAAVTDAQGQEGSDQESSRRRPGHQRLADIAAPEDTPRPHPDRGGVDPLRRLRRGGAGGDSGGGESARRA